MSSLVNIYRDARSKGNLPAVAYAMARYKNTEYPDDFWLRAERILFHRSRLPLRFLSNREVIGGRFTTRSPRCSEKALQDCLRRTLAE